jgi:DNA-binding transcriptional MerR regulator
MKVSVSPMYNIKMVAKLLGLTPVTIRAWENRYGAVHPARSEGGHRLYSDQDVEDLRWLQLQTSEMGLSISQAVRLLEKKRESFDETSETYNESRLTLNYDRLQVELYEALMAIDLEKAHGLVDQGFSMYELEEVFHHVLAPLMIRIGDEWEQGLVSVAREHLASEFVKQRCIQLFRMFHIHSSLPKVIAACPSGERHELGLLIFTLFLRRKGLEVIYLGQTTPVEDLVELINDRAADMLCISSSDAEQIDHTITYIDQVLLACPQVKIVLGGKGFHSLDKGHPHQNYVIGDKLENWERWYQQEVMI